jgi:hypothetical protein
MVNFYNANDSAEPAIPAATTGDYRDMNICEGWQPLQLSALSTDANTQNNSKTLITKQQTLVNKYQAYSSSLKSLRPQLSATGQYWLDIMINRLDFQVLYIQGLMSVNKAYGTFASSGKPAACTDLNNGLDKIFLSIMKLSECARNTSDLGLIGQINILVYNTLKQFIKNNGGVVGTPGRPSASLASGPKVHEIFVYGIDGRCIARQSTSTHYAKMPLIHSGIYFIKIKDAAGNARIVKKLLTGRQSLVTDIRE